MKTKILISSIALLLLAVVILLMEAPTESSSKQPPVQLNFNMEQGTASLGNMTYIPLNLTGTLHDNIGVVFLAIHEWEEENTSREIVEVDINWDKSETQYSTSAYTYGIIIRSRPKE